MSIERSRARCRYGQVTLAVIDADRFKALNDNQGHPTGDLVLRKLGSLIHHSFRQSDTAARYGGEEFVALLPESDLEVARKKVESLREPVATTPFALAPRGEPVQVTISAGLACFPQDGDDELALFGSADERLFQAKHEGRNRVVAASEPVLSDS